VRACVLRASNSTGVLTPLTRLVVPLETPHAGRVLGAQLTPLATGHCWETEITVLLLPVKRRRFPRSLDPDE